MQCIKPLKASLDSSGNITFSSKKAIPGLVPFQLPCRKCLPCRLNTAREKAIRCWHETKMHKDSIFLTLTYNDENLTTPYLHYPDFQLFMKSLLERLNRDIQNPFERIKIPYLVTGEYGEEKKRPHWHAILYNFRPEDAKKLYTTSRGDICYDSKFITDIWQKGKIEFGSVTLDSANYVARYAAKKLVHGLDHEHKYHPIHKTSSKHAIGKKWIEKYHEHTFNNGYVILPNGQKSGIPRYYKDWLKQHNFDSYLRYYTHTLPQTQKLIEEINRKETEIFQQNLKEQQDIYKAMSATIKMVYPETRSKVKLTILNQKFKGLQERLKL